MDGMYLRGAGTFDGGGNAGLQVMNKGDRLGPEHPDTLTA